MKWLTGCGMVGCGGIGLLLCAGIYSQFNYVRRRARLENCAGNMRQIGLGLAEYVQDNDGALPAVARPRQSATWKTDIMPYVKSKDVFLCSARGARRLDANGLPISYAANASGTVETGNNHGPFFPGKTPLNVAHVAAPEQVISVCEVGNTEDPGFNLDVPVSPWKLYAGHEGISNYLFLDNHVRSFWPTETAHGSATGASDPTNLWYLDGRTPLSAEGMRTLKTTQNAFPE